MRHVTIDIGCLIEKKYIQKGSKKGVNHDLVDVDRKKVSVWVALGHLRQVLDA